MATIEQVIKLLKHEDKVARRKAIVWLAKSGDEAALKPLVWSYRNDADTELRELARKGAQLLKKQLDEPASEWVSDFTNKESDPQDLDPAHDGYTDSYSSYSDSYSSYSGEDYEVSDDAHLTFDDDENDDESVPKDVSWETRTLIKKAMDFHFDGDDHKALEHLIEALNTDRAARNDQQLLNTAAAITGMVGEDAVRVLRTPDKQRELVAGFSGSKKSALEEGDPDWQHTWVDIGIYTLVNIVGATVIILLAVNRFQPLLGEIAQWSEYKTYLSKNDLQDFITPLLGGLQQITIVLILIAIGFAIYMVIVTLIQTMTVHFVAISVFEGKKPSSVTVDHLFNFQSLYMGISYAILLILVLTMPTNLEAYIGSNAETTAILSSLGFTVPFAILGIISPFAMAWVTGKAQKFGFFKGCLSNIVGGIVLSILSCGCSFIFQIALSIALATGGA